MAYLNPTTLTCPECGFSARIKIVVSVGPGSRKGDIAARSFLNPEPFNAELKDGKKTGTLLCPNDATPVWTNKRGYTMEGPMTEREMRRRLPKSGPFSGPHNPRDPFSAPPLKRATPKMARRTGGPVKPIQPKRSS